MSKRALLVAFGVIGLAAGALEYLLGRPHGSVYFLKDFPAHLFHRINVYGPLGQWAPDFLHPFSFSLIFIGLFSGSRRTRLRVCILWLVIDSSLEIGQRFGAVISGHCPSWFSGIPYLENTGNYFRHGRFDPLDLAAILLGAACAFIIGEIVLGGTVYENTESQDGCTTF